MNTAPESNDHEGILLQQSPLLDVRAPIEFAKGAFPQASNLPLLNNEERHLVGTCYKQNGQDKAIELGHALVSGQTKTDRVEAWRAFCEQNPTAYLYCFRGGLRSKTSQQWLADAGIEICLIQGGYRALRQCLLGTLAQADSRFDYALVAGLTGCRKTGMVQTLDNGIDLEGAAYHRGSSFGAHAVAQSTQVTFEHQLGIDLLNANKQQHQILSLEDESRFIGSVDIPANIYNKMRNSPLVVIEATLEQRLQQLLEEYVINMQAEFFELHQDENAAFNALSEYLLASMQRIRKRLGTERCDDLILKMQRALSLQKEGRGFDAHFDWLQPLLDQYYDPMYRSQLSKREGLIIFRGSFVSCKEFLDDYAKTAINR